MPTLCEIGYNQKRNGTRHDSDANRPNGPPSYTVGRLRFFGEPFASCNVCVYRVGMSTNTKTTKTTAPITTLDRLRRAYRQLDQLGYADQQREARTLAKDRRDRLENRYFSVPESKTPLTAKIEAMKPVIEALAAEGHTDLADVFEVRASVLDIERHDRWSNRDKRNPLDPAWLKTGERVALVYAGAQEGKSPTGHPLYAENAKVTSVDTRQITAYGDEGETLFQLYVLRTEQGRWHAANGAVYNVELLDHVTPEPCPCVGCRA